MWANAQPDGRPAEYRRRPVLNAAKIGSHTLLDCLLRSNAANRTVQDLEDTKWILHLAKFRYGATAAKNVYIVYQYQPPLPNNSCTKEFTACDIFQSHSQPATFLQNAVSISSNTCRSNSAHVRYTFASLSSVCHSAIGFITNLWKFTFMGNLFAHFYKHLDQKNAIILNI